MSEKLIKDIILDERGRCRALLIKLTRGGEKDFALFCIDNGIDVTDDLEHWRRRYVESLPEDNSGDLM